MINSNLLNIALSVLPKQPFQLLKYVDDATNSMGIKVAEYSEPIDLFGSIQSIELSRYATMGISQDKNYRILYTSYDVKGNDVQKIPDRVLYDGGTWDVVKTTPWRTSGWTGFLIVEDKTLR